MQNIPIKNLIDIMSHDEVENDIPIQMIMTIRFEVETTNFFPILSEIAPPIKPPQTHPKANAAPAMTQVYH